MDNKHACGLFSASFVCDLTSPPPGPGFPLPFQLLRSLSRYFLCSCWAQPCSKAGSEGGPGPLNTLSGWACTGSTSGEEWGFLGFYCGPWEAVDQKRSSLAGVPLARVTSWSWPPPALLWPCQLALQVELQVAPPLPMEGGPGQAGRHALDSRLDGGVGLEGKAGCCGWSEASPTSPVPFLGIIRAGACSCGYHLPGGQHRGGGSG